MRRSNRREFLIAAAGGLGAIAAVPRPKLIIDAP
jgi:hypothetical protein